MCFVFWKYRNILLKTSFCIFRLLGFVFLLMVLIFKESKSIEISCQFFNSEEHGLTCEVNRVTININDENKSLEVKLRHDSSRRLEEVKYLLFTDSLLESLTTDIFVKFQNVDRLGFDNCVVDVNDNKEFFREARRLKFLLITNSNVLRLTTDTFKYLENLREVVLNDNKIVTVKASAFENNPKLKKIHLSDNKIDNVDPRIFDILRLDFIDLRDNECTRSFVNNPRSNTEKLTSQLFRCFRNYEYLAPEPVIPRQTTTTRRPTIPPTRAKKSSRRSTTPKPYCEDSTYESNCDCSNLKNEIKRLKSLLQSQTSCNNNPYSTVPNNYPQQYHQTTGNNRPISERNPQFSTYTGGDNERITFG